MSVRSKGMQFGKWSLVPALLLAATGLAQAEFDVAGLKLGMTEAQAKAAMKAYNPAFRISPVYGYFSYFDGKTHGAQTPQFLDRIEALDSGNQVELAVQFSGPPSTPKVIGIKRQSFNHTNPPSPQQFKEALHAKYGAPNVADKGTLVWDQAGKPQCNRADPKRVGHNAYNYGGTEKQLGFLTRKGLPANLEQCGSFMVYQFQDYQAVTGFNVYVTDVGAYVQSERDADKWVQSLEQQAQQKTTASGKTPRL